MLLHEKCKDDERVALEKFLYAMVALCRLGDKSHVGNRRESDEGRPSAKQIVAREISAVDLDPPIEGQVSSWKHRRSQKAGQGSLGLVAISHF